MIQVLCSPVGEWLLYFSSFMLSDDTSLLSSLCVAAICCVLSLMMMPMICPLVSSL